MDNNVTITANVIEGSSSNPNVTNGATVQTNVAFGTPIIGNVQTGGLGPKGDKGDQGEKGDTGDTGPTGPGVPDGGTTGQILRKISNTNQDTEWHTSAKADIGLGNVDNTSDANKPISTATQTALDAKVAGPASVTDDLPAVFDGTTGKLIKSKTYAAFKTLLALVKGDVGLGNVDNTADSAKNVLSATKLTTARTIDGVSFDGTGNITTIAEATHAATSKATPVDADEIPLVDSAASNVLKKLTWANLKATAKTYFDSLYQPLDADLTTIAGLTPTTDNFMVATSSAWASRTPSQARSQMGLGAVALLSTVTEADITLADNTTNNFSTTKHGFVPKGTNAGNFLKDDGTWAAIPGGGDALTSNPLSQFASTTSLQLKGVMSDETGSGALVFGTSPNITTPTGIVKGDVGLGSVTNDAQIKAADFPSSSVDSEIALFSSTTGKVLKRATTTGILKAASGVIAAAVAETDYVTPTGAGTLQNKVFDSTSPTAFFYPGIMVPTGRKSAPTGWLLCDGSAVSRSTYSDLFAALCESVGTFTVTVASPAVVTLNSHGLITGDQVYLTTTGALPTGLSANTLYYAIRIDANTFNLATTRANAVAGTKINTSGTQSGTHTLRWCPYGLGDGSTTFTLPDLRGRVIAGNDAMGGTAAARLNLADALGSSGNPGASGGEQRHTMTVGELVTHSHNVNRTTGAGATTTYGVPPTNNTFSSNDPNAVNSAGSSTPFNLVQPTLVANYMIKT